jgi:hypothetical protein
MNRTPLSFPTLWTTHPSHRTGLPSSREEEQDLSLTKDRGWPKFNQPTFSYDFVYSVLNGLHYEHIR